MEKILRKLIEYGLVGVDTYTHNDSTWLIFTDNKQWVIELTENKTLWYNFTFFKSLFNVATEDVIENQKHITKWVEDNLINKKPTCVTHFRDVRDGKQQFEDTIENGVIKTKGFKMRTDWSIEDTIQNGVRHTDIGWHQCNNVDDTIENGVKETNHVDVMKFFDNKMENTLQNGVKETNSWDDSIDGDLNQFWCVDNIINNGVKETHDDVYHHKGRIDGVIMNGVKETKVCNYTDPKTQLMWAKWGYQIDEVINCGEKISGTYVGGNRQKDNIESVIGYGIKETKTLGNGNLLSAFQCMEEHNTKSVPKMIENGVKEIKGDASQNPTGKVTKVIKDGIKNPTD
jgi:hypothetical protein